MDRAQRVESDRQVDRPRVRTARSPDVLRRAADRARDPISSTTSGVPGQVMARLADRPDAASEGALPRPLTTRIRQRTDRENSSGRPSVRVGIRQPSFAVQRTIAIGPSTGKGSFVLLAGAPGHVCGDACVDANSHMNDRRHASRSFPRAVH